MRKDGAAENGGRSIRRACRILKALKHHVMLGVALQELAEALNENKSAVLRALAAMREEGLVIQYETGRYALSAQMVQIAQSALLDIDRTADRAAELKRNILAGARN